jgi:hypothetical protein
MHAMFFAEIWSEMKKGIRNYVEDNSEIGSAPEQLRFYYIIRSGYFEMPPGIFNMHGFHSQLLAWIDVVLIRISDEEYLIRPQAHLARPGQEDS